jgi:DNA polymerase IV
MPLPSRTILHVDLDAFFAAIEVREDPRLVGKPVIVGADPKGGQGRGVVAAASYEARAYGIHSAMPISRAYACCPRGVYLRPRMKLYAETSRRFMAILHRYTDLVEPLSIDEAFLDVTGSLGLFGDGETIARRIKADVRRDEDLSVSVGMAPTKFVAKIASDLRKPDGLVVVQPDEVDAFLCELPVERLWGAGPKTIAHFRRLGVSTIGALRLVALDQLRAAFGEAGARQFANLARGIDPRDVIPGHERKSIGHEITFEWDVGDRDRVERSLLSLVDQVTHRLRSHGLAGRTVTVKLRTEDFATITRRARLLRAADTTETIWPVALRLLKKADRGVRKIRLIGLALSNFCEGSQMELFEPAQVRKERKLADAVDTVIARFGNGAITRGALLPPRARRPRRRA